jgi:hypothetical protein
MLISGKVPARARAKNVLPDPGEPPLERYGQKAIHFSVVIDSIDRDQRKVQITDFREQAMQSRLIGNGTSQQRFA